jgi:hypothetical protein
MQYSQKIGGIEKGEYWIIDVAVQYSQYMSSLRHPEEYLEQAFNRKGHSLTYIEILDTLDKLFQKGDLIAFCDPNDITPFSTDPFIPTREQIDSAMKKELPYSVFYGLTFQGGTRWESSSKTNWDFFFDFAHSEEDKDEEDGLLVDDGRGFFYTKSDREMKVIVIGGSQKILQEYLNYGLADPFKIIDIESISWEILGAWQPTYWKTLAQSYRLSYIAQPLLPKSESDHFKINAFDYIYSQWRRSTIGKWYTNPFDSKDN